MSRNLIGLQAIELFTRLSDRMFVGDHPVLRDHFSPARHTYNFDGLIVDYRAWINLMYPETKCIACWTSIARFVCVIKVYSIRMVDQKTHKPFRIDLESRVGRQMMRLAEEHLLHLQPLCLTPSCVRPPAVLPPLQSPAPVR